MVIGSFGGGGGGVKKYIISCCVSCVRRRQAHNEISNRRRLTDDGRARLNLMNTASARPLVILLLLVFKSKINFEIDSGGWSSVCHAFPLVRRQSRHKTPERFYIRVNTSFRLVVSEHFRYGSYTHIILLRLTILCIMFPE